jgi:hypothetical protein
MLTVSAKTDFQQVEFLGPVTLTGAGVNSTLEQCDIPLGIFTHNPPSGGLTNASYCDLLFLNGTVTDNSFAGSADLNSRKLKMGGGVDGFHMGNVNWTDYGSEIGTLKSFPAGTAGAQSDGTHNDGASIDASGTVISLTKTIFDVRGTTGITPLTCVQIPGKTGVGIAEFHMDGCTTLGGIYGINVSGFIIPVFTIRNHTADYGRNGSYAAIVKAAQWAAMTVDLNSFMTDGKPLAIRKNGG